MSPGELLLCLTMLFGCTNYLYFLQMLTTDTGPSIISTRETASYKAKREIDEEVLIGTKNVAMDKITSTSSLNTKATEQISRTIEGKSNDFDMGNEEQLKHKQNLLDRIIQSVTTTRNLNHALVDNTKTTTLHIIEKLNEISRKNVAMDKVTSKSSLNMKVTEQISRTIEGKSNDFDMGNEEQLKHKKNLLGRIIQSVTTTRDLNHVLADNTKTTTLDLIEKLNEISRNNVAMDKVTSKSSLNMKATGQINRTIEGKSNDFDMGNEEQLKHKKNLLGRIIQSVTTTRSLNHALADNTKTTTLDLIEKINEISTKTKPTTKFDSEGNLGVESTPIVNTEITSSAKEQDVAFVYSMINGKEQKMSTPSKQRTRNTRAAVLTGQTKSGRDLSRSIDVSSNTEKIQPQLSKSLITKAATNLNDNTKKTDTTQNTASVPTKTKQIKLSESTKEITSKLNTKQNSIESNINVRSSIKAHPTGNTSETPTASSKAAPTKKTSETSTESSKAHPTGNTSETPTESSKAHPTRKPSETSTEYSKETPTGNTSKTPTKSTNASPTMNTSKTPTKSTNAFPTRNTSTTPTKSTNASPTRNTSTTPTKSTNASPTRNTSETPTKSSKAHPTRKTSETPTESSKAHPTRLTSETSTESSKATPTGNTSKTPTKSANASPTKNISATSTKSSNATPTGKTSEIYTKSSTVNHIKNSTENPTETTSETKSFTVIPTETTSKISSKTFTETPIENSTETPSENPMHKIRALTSIKRSDTTTNDIYI